MPHQEALTLVCAIDPARLPALETVLKELARDPGDNPVLPFSRLPSCHFARVLSLPPSHDLDGDYIGPQLVLLSDCDGSATAHLRELVEVAGAGIDRLFSCCTGYPPLPASPAARLEFLERKRVQVNANYVHRPGRGVGQIRDEARLRLELRRRYTAEGPRSSSALDARERLAQSLRRDAGWAWAFQQPEGIGLQRELRDVLHGLGIPVAALLASPLLAPLGLVLLGLVRLREERDSAEHIQPSAEHLHELQRLEDRAANSGFSAGGYVKAGWLRQAVMRSVLQAIGFGSRHLFTRDSLAGIKTIHFARWIPLDGGRRVLFTSNFDGSVESYNNDFIDIVAWGLNLVFSNGHGYPKTRWLVLDGARREQEFKDYLRRHQIPTPIWYSAYPELTAENVAKNARLRRGLKGKMNEKEAGQWLSLL